MRLSLKSLIIFLILIFPLSLSGQLKYVGVNKGAISISTSYGKIEKSDIFGAQVNYSSEGKIGVGLSYFHNETQPRGDGVGFHIEYALLRPMNKLALGINALGSFATTWAKTTYATPYFSPGAGQMVYSVQNTTLRSNSFIVGAELYLKTPQNDFTVEPFVQVARTFSKLSSANYSEKLSRNSLGFGADLLIRVSETNKVILIPGMVFQEHVSSSFVISLLFCHNIN
ncbi:MAG: hypothetical protein HYV29_09440 [Ignavibacteriales bacterium]|nr:hypothetical protein [Ignavibacteriales bacterium]